MNSHKYLKSSCFLGKYNWIVNTEVATVLDLRPLLSGSNSAKLKPLITDSLNDKTETKTNKLGLNWAKLSLSWD